MKNDSMATPAFVTLNLLCAFGLWGCDGESSGNRGDDDGELVRDAAADGGPDAGVDGENDAATSREVCMPLAASCPTHRASELFVCELDSSLTTNFVEDPRLEFGSAPDIAVEFEAPETGTYVFSLRERPHQGCGISVVNNSGDFHPPSVCPEPGDGATAVDGIFVSDGQDFELRSSQQILLLLGCPDWARPAVGTFILSATRL